MKVVAAAEAELRPKVAEADLELGPAAMLVVEPDAVVAEPIVAVAGILAEPVEPKGVALEIFAGVVAPMVVDDAAVFEKAVPMGPGAAAALVGLEVDPKMVAFLAYLVVHEIVPKVAGPLFAHEADSRMAGFEGSKYLGELEAVLGSGRADVLPMVVVVGTDLEVDPGAALELDAKNW